MHAQQRRSARDYQLSGCEVGMGYTGLVDLFEDGSSTNPVDVGLHATLAEWFP